MDLDSLPGRVLVVDDNAASRRLLQTQLEEGGFEVEVAGSAEECMEKSRDFRPEVILLDIRMPGVDGIETCRWLKEAYQTADTPVVFVTGHGDDEDTVVRALAAGGNDFLSKDCSHHILIARAHSQLSISRAHAKLKRLAMTDSLTGLFNHAYFHDSIEREVVRSNRHDLRFALVLLGIDGFKAINEKHGYRAGDEVLKQFAEVVKGQIRRSDLPFYLREQDVAARYGGDQFALLLPETDKVGAAVKAELIRRSVEEEVLGADGTAITLSAGVASYPGDARDRNALIQAASVALTAAKHAGRNRIISYSGDLIHPGERRSEATEREAARIEALERTIDDRRIRYLYQPIVTAADGAIVAYEALCRPTDPAFPGPLELLTAAERTGKLLPLGRVMRECCVEPMAQLAAERLMFINVHPQDLNDPDLGQGEAFLREWASRVVFEITEAVEIKNFEQFRRRIAGLREAGFRVAVDDLGAGYSGLNSLAQLEPDFVKLDMGMVRGIDTNGRSARLIKHILEFAREEEIQVVAEGIETADELETVKRLGVPLVQGYYFSKPAPPFIEL